MKSGWWAVGASALLLSAPAAAQDESVKAGVDAYERGEYQTAVDQWRGAALRGNADAQFNLGQAYKLGRGVPIDLKLAEDWYRKAALQGHEQAEANYGLALFENNKRRDAVQWLQRAVARGDARAQYVLGVMLFNGDSIQKDWVRAYALMVRASQTGLESAVKALAQMDQYVPLGDRQQGLALARTYEEEYNRGGMPVPPLQGIAAAPEPLLTVAPRPAPPQSEAAPARPPAPRVTAPVPVRDGGWRIQLGAFGDPANARKLWSQVRGRFSGRQPYYVRAGALTRLLVGPYGSRADAASACAAVKPCVPMRE